MEGNLNMKNFKPTLSTPTTQGKKFDTNFKKQMRPTGMSIKENGMVINEKEQSLKKKIFKLDKMETLVHTDEDLSRVFNEMKEDAAEKFGYHWNETILNIIFNDYILNSPKYLHKYKVTRAKEKTRRGAEGIAQLQNDIDKEKEASSGAESRKQELMAKVDSGEDKEKVDELFGFGKNAASPAPTAPTSKDDTYFVDTAKKKLLGVVPARAASEEKQRIMGQFLGKPNVKQLAWLAAFDLGVQGIPNKVSDGTSIDQIKKEMTAKYKGGYEGIPALAEDGNYVKTDNYEVGNNPESWAKVGQKDSPHSIKADKTLQDLANNFADKLGKPRKELKEVEEEMSPETYKLQVVYALKALKPGLELIKHILYVKPETDERQLLQLIQNNYATGISPQETAQSILAQWTGVNETTGSASSGAFATRLGGAKGKQEIADVTYQNETTTSSSSGQYSGKAIWAKNPENSRFANKPAWKGGKIVGESVVHGDLDYFTDPKVFAKYIMKNEILQILNEEYSLEEAESFQQHAQRMLGKLNQYSIEDPILKNDPDFQGMIKVWTDRAQGKGAQQAVPPAPAAQQQAAPVQQTASATQPVQNATAQWKQQPAPVAEATDRDRYEDVVFLQGEEAYEALEILNNQGEDAAMEYLKQWHDHGNHQGRNELPHGSSDQTYDKDGYHMAWNDSLGYIGLTYDFTHDNEPLAEHHLNTREEKINFLATNANIPAQDLASKSDEEINQLYLAAEKHMGMNEEGGNDKGEVYYEIEARLRPTDDALPFPEINDIANQYGVDFEDVAQTMMQVISDRENRKETDARTIASEALKELGHGMDKTVTFEEVAQWAAQNYDQDEYSEDQLATAYEKFTTDPNQLSMFEADSNFINSMKKDLAYTGHKVDGSESENELESKDGLFKGKWNENKPLEENAGLAMENLLAWAAENILYGKTDPAPLITQYAQDNGTTVQGLRDKAKFYSANSQLFPNGREVKEIMGELIYAIDVEMGGVSEGMGGDGEVGEDRYKEEQSTSEYMALENQMKELTALRNSGDFDALDAKLRSLPIIPISNHSGNQREFGHGDLVDAGYMKKDYSHYGHGEDDFEITLQNISKKPIARLNGERSQEIRIIQPGQIDESIKNKKPLISEGIFGNASPELDVNQIVQAIDGFKQAPESPEYRERFVKAKDYVKTKAGQIARLPQLKMWLDKNMPQLSNYVSTLWGNWELLPTNKLSENKDEMNIDKNQYKELVKAKLKSSGKSLKGMGDDEKKSFFNEAHGEYKQIKESLIGDQPDSIINNQETSIANSMDSDELNTDGASTSSSSAAPAVAASSIGGAAEQEVKEGYDNDDLTAKQSVLDKAADYSEEEPVLDEPEAEVAAEPTGKVTPQYYNQGGDDSQTAVDADKFRAALKAKYGVDSVSDLSHSERQELMKSMNFGAKEKENPMDFAQYAKSDADRINYAKENDPTAMLDYLSKNVGALKSTEDFKSVASQFKAATGKNMQHPMAIYAAIKGMSPENRGKFADLENYFKSNMGKPMEEKLNEDRKPSAILNVEKLGAENAKNFKKDLAQEDGVDQSNTYPEYPTEDSYKAGMHKAQIWPDPSKFYIEQDNKKVQADMTSFEEIEKAALAKSKGALENIGNSTADGKHIPKRNLTKDEMYQVAMNRGDGMHNIVYDNKPSDKFEERMKQDMGKEVYDNRQEKMDYRSHAPMYNKDTQPTSAGDKKDENNKFKVGYNTESVTGKYKDEYSKFKLVEFKLGDVEIVQTVSNEAYPVSLDGMGNKYSLVGKKINENTGFENIAEKFSFYLIENKVVAIEKAGVVEKTETPKEVVNESKFDKMKHLMNYKPSNYVDAKKSVKF